MYDILLAFMLGMGYYVQNTLNSPPLLICLVYFSSVGRFSMFCLPFTCVYFVSPPAVFPCVVCC
jgi:hypothetical protein